MADMTDEQILELTPELMVNIIKGRGEIIDQYRKEVERLQKYEKLVHFIANDYVELSHDKAQNEYILIIKKCRKLIEEE